MTAFTFSRWDFLTEPLPAVLAECGAAVETDPQGGDFLGGIRADVDRLTVVVSDSLEGLEYDLTVRGLLAAWHYVDVSDWPLAMCTQGGQS